MTDFMNRLTQMLSTPWIPWIILGVIAVGVLLGQVQKHVPDDPIARIKKTFGAEDMPHGVALAIVLLWIALGAVLAAGLLTLLAEIAWSTVRPETPTGESDFRFLLTKATALTAVLGGLIALPFTALRLKHTATQTRHAEDVLFNEKLNDANTDLHARYQTTEKQEDGTYVDIWKDDIIRRNGAIDRLEALAIERPVMAPRIARMLCVYLKEMSREYPAEPAPEDVREIFPWVHNLSVKRSDMESAAQVLGRMAKATGIDPQILAIDLRGVNLQAMDLSDLNFAKANLGEAHADGAFLFNTTLKDAHLHYVSLVKAIARNVDFTNCIMESSYLIGANLRGCNFENACLNASDLTYADVDQSYFKSTFFDGNTNFDVRDIGRASFRDTDLTDLEIDVQMFEHAFGDASVLIEPFPEHWPDYELDDEEFERENEECTVFGMDAYIPPQLRTPPEQLAVDPPCPLRHKPS